MHLESTVDADRRQHWLSRAAWAGIVGPILFVVAFLAQELARRNEYDPFAETVSALEAGPYGWVQQVNFVVFGVLTIVFAIGLHLGIQRSRAGVVGPALLVASGVGSLISAIFPLREDAAGMTYDPGGHMVGGMTFFLGSGVGLIVLSRRLRHDERWRGLAGYTLGAGLAIVAASPVMTVLVIPDDAPLHDWAGVAQRVILLVLFPCRVVLSIRLLRCAGGGWRGLEHR
ncbi:MAG TPA: DUF998 domain-containing protein [Acidothermales bacterium]